MTDWVSFEGEREGEARTCPDERNHSNNDYSLPPSAPSLGHEEVDDHLTSSDDAEYATGDGSKENEEGSE